MKSIISFTILSSVKILARIFYRFEFKWLGNPQESWDDIRFIVFLNHTSLFEPLYIGIPPFSFLAKLSQKMVAPGADKTLNRPLVGKFWKFLSPGMVSITRRRDRSWREFMKRIEKDSIIVIAPEGRMKRANGLDLNGRPMTVKAGVADILDQLNQGRMLIAYSGGLHHVQIPGSKKIRLFKTLKMNGEVLDIKDYKRAFEGEGIQWKRQVVKDMQWRLENNCPKAD